LTFDKDGKVKRNIQMDPDLLVGDYEIVNGYSQDYWMGCLSPCFIHILKYEDKLPCEIKSSFLIKEEKKTLQVSDNDKPENILLTPFKIKITSKPSTISTKPAKVFIKNLCE
jgi:hypothetical protein